MRTTHPPSRTTSNRFGLSLLEVMLAVSIFTMSMAAIYQLIAIGYRNTIDSRLQTQAIVRAESKISEVIANADLMQTTAASPFEEDASTSISGTWTWSLTVSPWEVDATMVNLELTTQYETADGTPAAVFTLRRLVRDPQAIADLQAEQEAALSEL
ncbi:type IV pilus modification PilV family protein [Thalassoroseus pseudoceratinae]|uniref:type IV pilus modification PilV family protein n=1 Tax=Thalassoroseus pseudoceratinae TaxID=2713176 RepID=UPI0014229171|nr:prepilin-type N-terminal cleavage/methylation domain-containing protein [Thalassoroseus pseudoceratinae]